MSYVVRANSVLPKVKAWTVNQPAVSPAERERQTIPTRRAEISWLKEDGTVGSKNAVIPAMPVFLDAMSAVAQGTLIQTPEGKVAIEDLEPGMKVSTADGGVETIQWVGSMTMFPSSRDMNMPSSMLYRVTDGGYGLDRTAPDLMLGPAARVLPGMFATDSSSPLRDVKDMADGFSVIEIRPMSPVRVFHLALGNHRLIRANGVLIESYHPGSNVQLHLSREMLPIFMGMFPHLKGDGAFGALKHRRVVQ